MGFDPVSRLLFPAPAASYDETSFPGELLWIPRIENAGSSTPGKEKIQNTAPEDRIPCIFLKYTSARFIVFYLHTNAEDIGKCHSFCSCIRAQFQVHVFAVEYPGYGICPGGPCDEQGLTGNAFAALHFLREVLHWPLDSILIVGRSIGCGPAISLAVRYQVSGMIIISPMLSFRELCKDLIGPLGSVVTERFPNKSRMQFVRSAVLVVHGQKDVTIPYRHGLELFQMCKSRKLFVGPEDMGHNANMFANVSYMVMPMLHFFALPDYCFDDIKVPSWAYDRFASMDPHEPEVPISMPARVHAPWEDALGDAGPECAKQTPHRAKPLLLPAKQVRQPTEPSPLRPQGAEADAPAGPPPPEKPAESAELEKRPPEPKPPEPPKRPTTIKLPLKAEQERTASRSLLSKVSDRPLPAPVSREAVIPPYSAGDETTPGVCPLQRWSPKTPYRNLNPLQLRLACCFTCPAEGEGPDAWEASDGQQLGRPVLKGVSAFDSAKEIDENILQGTSGWGNGL